MTLDDYLAVPYVLRLSAVRDEHGDWVRRAEHPELPGCVTEAATPDEAIERLETVRRAWLAERLARGESIPLPRSPLQGSARRQESRL